MERIQLHQQVQRQLIPLPGTITPGATGGTYTVTYTVAAAGGCAVYTTTAPLTITTAPSGTFSYAGSPYCTSSGTAPVTTTALTPGGTYSSTAGLSINGTTGAITTGTSTAGTYTVTYTVNASGCAPFTTTAQVTITAAPSGTFSYAGSPYCATVGAVAITNNSLTPGGTFSATGLTINPSTGAITTTGNPGGTYTVTYTVNAANGCGAYTTTAPVTITAVPTAVAGSAPVLTCANSGAINITAGSSATNYSSVVWTSSGTGTFANANSLTLATYNPSAADITAGSVTLTLTANASFSM